MSISASPPNSEAQGVHKASRQQMPLPRDANIPAPDRAADDDPHPGDAMEAKTATSDDKTTELHDLHLPSNLQEEIGVRKDTTVTIECAEDLDMGDAGLLRGANAAPGEETMTD